MKVNVLFFVIVIFISDFSLGGNLKKDRDDSNDAKDAYYENSIALNGILEKYVGEQIRNDGLNALTQLARALNTTNIIKNTQMESVEATDYEKEIVEDAVKLSEAASEAASDAVAHALLAIENNLDNSMINDEVNTESEQAIYESLEVIATIKDDLENKIKDVTFKDDIDSEDDDKVVLLGLKEAIEESEEATKYALDTFEDVKSYLKSKFNEKASEINNLASQRISLLRL